MPSQIRYLVFKSYNAVTLQKWINDRDNDGYSLAHFTSVCNIAGEIAYTVVMIFSHGN